MRLLKYSDHGEVSLTNDLLGNDEIPPYAILSHTWGTEEVTFDDLTTHNGKDKAGQTKIRFCMEQAAQDGIHYSWVDTCCINKTDTTELQHAINSMFRWYQEAATCYVFLSDVSTIKRKVDSESFQASWEPAFRASRWFTRGWTLQELLAPRAMKFFSREGRLLGEIQALTTLIHDVTKLPVDVLRGTPLHTFGIEERLSWTKKRTTTREEDKAYSLLGLFDIFMPLIYGEGQENAFRRLRKEIRERKYAFQSFLNLSERDFECLQSLSFTEQEHRHHDVHTANETCEWLLRDPRYNKWVDRPHGLLWIKGDPGSGKSVLMKHAIRSMTAQQGDSLVVSYFIHGQGSDLQRTSIGVYRALLNSILGHFPLCLAKLTALEDREKRFGGYAAGRWLWNCKELQEALAEVLLEHTQNQQITIFVDALDESGEGPARHLLAYFGDLSRRAVKSNAKVRICLSSRHYPMLGLNQFPAISVEEENHEDIQWYVNDRLKGIYPFHKRQQVEEEILLKAQGGFQWAFLITGTLIDRTLTGRSLFGHVNACPPTLRAMYAALLDTASDEDRRQSMKLFRWVLYAKRPLSAQELREALATNADMAFKSVAELRSHTDWSETLEDFERYVNYISKGLIAFRSREIWEQWEDSDREAQLIHQSVADFLLERCAMATQYGSIGTGHFMISRSCLKYLTLQELLNERRLPRDKLSSRFPLAPYAVRYVFEHIKETEEAGHDQSDLTSVINWSPHSEPVRQLHDLWITLNPNNVGTPAGWPFVGSPELHFSAALGLKGQVLATLNNGNEAMNEEDLDGNSVLHVALLAGQPDIVLLLIKQWQATNKGLSVCDVARSIGLNTRNVDGDTLLDVAVAMEEYSLVTELIAVGADLRRMSQPHLLIRHAILNDNMTLLMELIDGGIKLAGAVYFAIEHGSRNHIVEQLLEAGGDLDRLETDADDSDQWFEDFDLGSTSPFAGGNALHLACRDGLAASVDLLLSHGASASALDDNQRCPLHIGVLNSDISGHIIQSLLESSPATVDLEDDYGRTPLSIAYDHDAWDIIRVFLEHGQFSSSSEALTTILLERLEDASFWRLVSHDGVDILLPNLDKVDLGMKRDQGRNVFWLAASNGLSLIVKRMMDMGVVDVNERDVTRKSALLAAVHGEHESTIGCLLTAEQLNVNAQDEDGNFPLLVASQAGYFTIVKALLGRKDIDANATDARGLSSVHAAISAGFSLITQALLEKGGTDVTKPLFEAIKAKNTATISFLLKNGCIKINAKNATGTPLLSAAIEAGLTEVAQTLLLIDDINVNARDQWGQTPLLLAVRHRSTSIVQHLLRVPTLNGNLQCDHKGRTALFEAMLQGDVAMVRLLLQIPAIEVNIKDRTGATPLTEAARLGRTAVLQEILQAPSIDVNVRDDFDATPLFYASKHDRLVEQEALLAAGADYIVAEAFSPLLGVAIQRKTPGVSGLLLQLGQGECGINLLQSYGCAALDLAIEAGDEEMVEILLNTMSQVLDSMGWITRRVSQTLHLAVTGGNPSIVKMLIEADMFYTESVDRQGHTPLWLAARQDDTTIFNMLLADTSVNLDVEDPQGRSLLSWAAETGKLTVAAMLVQTGRVNLHHVNRDERTPFQEARRNAHASIAAMLPPRRGVVAVRQPALVDGRRRR